MKEPNVARYRIRYQGWSFVHNLSRLDEGLFRIRKWTKEHTPNPGLGLQFPFCIWERRTGPAPQRDGSDGVRERVRRSKPTQFQFQHISPNYILWSLAGDYSCLILTNAAE